MATPKFRNIDKKVTTKVMKRLGTDSVDYFDGANTITISGVFDKGFEETAEVEGSNPQFTANTDDVPNVIHGHTLTISGTTYNVVGLQPDGLSITTLMLEEQ